MVAGRFLAALFLTGLAVGGVIPGAFGQTTAEEGETVLGEAGGPVNIEWDSAETLFRIEVRRDGQIFIDTERSENSLQLNLAPGFYEYRITVLNPFGKAVTSSDWQPLTVHRARIPYFRVITPLVVWEGENEAVFDVVSANLRDGTLFALFDGDETRIEASWTEGEGDDTVRVGIEGLAPGSWDLEATDPSGRTFVHPDALIIRPTRPPAIRRTDTRRIPNEGLVPVAIEGEAFDPEMEVTVEGPKGELTVAAVNVTDAENATIYLDMTEAEPGDYDVTVINPAGEKDRRSKAVTVVAAAEFEKEKEHPRLELQAGFAPMIIRTPDGILPVFIAVEAAAGFHSGWTAPFLGGLGVETRGTVGMSGPWKDDIGVNACWSLDLAGYWRPRVASRYAPVLFLGVGNLWSGQAADFGLGNILFIRAGAAMDIVRIRKLSRIGVNCQIGFSDGEALPMVSLIMRRGFRM